MAKLIIGLPEGVTQTEGGPALEVPANPTFQGSTAGIVQTHVNPQSIDMQALFHVMARLTDNAVSPERVQGWYEAFVAELQEESR